MKFLHMFLCERFEPEEFERFVLLNGFDTGQEFRAELPDARKLARRPRQPLLLRIAQSASEL